MKTTPWYALLAILVWAFCSVVFAYPELDETQLDFLENPNPDYFIKKGFLVNYDDYNFDGLMDFQVLVFPNASFSLYYYFLWNEQENKYEENARLSSMGNIVLDKNKKTVTAIEKGGQGSCVFKFNTYKYQNNSYKLIETLTQILDKKNGIYVRTHNALKANGEATTTIDTIPPQNCRPKL